MKRFNISMNIKYAVMMFDLPEYCGGNCDTLEVFDNLEEAIYYKDSLEYNEKNDNISYYISIRY